MKKILFQTLWNSVKKPLRYSIFLYFIFVVGFILFSSGNPTPFIIAYGMLSFLFLIESRLTAGFALIFFCICGGALFFRHDLFAHRMVLAGYYFLIIFVCTRTREFLTEEKKTF